MRGNEEVEWVVGGSCVLAVWNAWEIGSARFHIGSDRWGRGPDYCTFWRVRGEKASSRSKKVGERSHGKEDSLRTAEDSASTRRTA